MKPRYHCPCSTPVRPGENKAIYRGTVPTKIDRVLTFTVFPRCSPGHGPGSITVSSRCRPVCPGFSTVHSGGFPIHPGGVPVHPGGVPVHPGPATVLLWCLPVLKMLATGTEQDSGSPRCHPGYPRFAPDHPGLSRSSPIAITVCDGVAPVTRFLTSPPVRPGSMLTIQYNREGSPVYPGSSRIDTVALRFYPGSSRFIPVYHDLSNRGEPGKSTGTVRTYSLIKSP